MSPLMIRIVTGVLALLVLGVIILRRKKAA
jgi:hypothetical protein